MIYANHAGTSWPKPAAVLEAVAATLRAGPEAGDVFEAARDATCRLLGIGDGERFLFTSSCTSALDVALSDLPWEAGDVIVTSALEHHAMVRPVQRLVRDRGVRHVVAPYLPGAPVDVDFVRDTLRDGSVRLLAMTHASNVTGEVLPVTELVPLAHEYDALFLLDAAQTIGILPVDVAALAVDVLTFAGHKGPLGPQGIGGLWAAPGVTFDAASATCAIRDAGRRADASATFPGYCDVGSVNMAGAAGLREGIRWLTARGYEATGGHARRLATTLRKALAQWDHCVVYGSEDVEHTAAVSIAICGIPLDRAAACFRERSIVVRAGRHCAPMALNAIGAPAGTLRISFGASNTEDDVDAVVQVIDATRGTTT